MSPPVNTVRQEWEQKLKECPFMGLRINKTMFTNQDCACYRHLSAIHGLVIKTIVADIFISSKRSQGIYFKLGSR